MIKMKKIILFAAAMLLSLSAFADENAQKGPRAIGGQLGYGAEITYQHAIQERQFVEANLGLNYMFGYGIRASYNWILVQPQWTDYGNWALYAGPGVGIGFGHGLSRYINNVNFGVMAILGVEFDFPFPLKLSAELHPGISLGVGDGNETKKILNIGSFFGFVPTIGVKYRF